MSRLAWQCRRGLRELDELLQRYLAQRYPQASVSEQRAFERLLQSPDPQLQAYLLSETRPHDPELQDVVDAIREHRA
ncbi:MAG TPA: succinate dehydrogenase assembly factor 2 [Steroidobacteraceae bacterium]|nr:succinate dehydrogenase assembly factor 2 [Steroidobacteraceae bacterium]